MLRNRRFFDRLQQSEVLKPTSASVKLGLLLLQAKYGRLRLQKFVTLSSEKINQFYFRGFIPAENVAREQEWQQLKKTKEALVLMDTPYRLKKMLDECCLHLPDRKILLTINLSQETESVLEGTPSQVKNNLKADKAEFMILVYAR